MLALQSSGYRELPAPESVESPSTIPFKKESVMMIRKMLAESLKALSMYSTKLDPAMLRTKQLMGLPPLPMIEDGPAEHSHLPPAQSRTSSIPRVEEEVKEPAQKQTLLSGGYDENDYAMSKFYNEHLIDSPACASPNPLLPSSSVPSSRLLSPVLRQTSLYNQEDSYPNYYGQMDIQSRYCILGERYRTSIRRSGIFIRQPGNKLCG